MGRDPTRLKKYGWLGIIAVAIFACCLLPLALWPDPNKVVDRIPIGSKLTELEEYIADTFKRSYSVWERIPDGRGDRDHRVKSSVGGFFARQTTKPAGWLSESPEREAFIGKILLYHHSIVIPDDLAPSYYIELVYVDGVLEQKDIGYLPG